MFNVEVVFATDTDQKLFTVSMSQGAVVRDAINASGILTEFPQIDLTNNPVGIFSQRVSLDDTIKAGDRIEIYRELICDPKERRRQKSKTSR